jgi:hypothetical protein
VDGAEEEDGEEADARSMGIRCPGGRGKSRRKPPAFRGPTAADRQRGGGRGRQRVGGRWISGGRRRRRIPWGRRRGEPWKAAIREDDGSGGGGHDDDDGGRSGMNNWQVLEGEGRCYYI